jgi:hypothetical protein
MQINIKSKFKDLDHLIKQHYNNQQYLPILSDYIKIDGIAALGFGFEVYSEEVIPHSHIDQIFYKVIPKFSFITTIEFENSEIFKSEVFVVDDPRASSKMLDNFTSLIREEILNDVNLQELNFVWDNLYINYYIIDEHDQD